MTLRLTGLLAMLFLLAGAQDAAAALRKIEQAYELDLAQVTLPAVAGGSLTLRRCASCAPELLRLDAQAMFQVLPARCWRRYPGRDAGVTDKPLFTRETARAACSRCAQGECAFGSSDRTATSEYSDG